MGVGSVVFVSDTHLGPAAPAAEANWDAVVRYVAATAPDLVIHVGDLTLDGAHDPEQLQQARAQLDRLPVAWKAVPGNHDVGDNPWPGAPDGITIDAELAAAPPYRFVPPSARQRLDTLVRHPRVRLVVSGHVHQHRVLDLDGGSSRVDADHGGGPARRDPATATPLSS